MFHGEDNSRRSVHAQLRVAEVLMRVSPRRAAPLGWRLVPGVVAVCSGRGWTRTEEEEREQLERA